MAEDGAPWWIVQVAAAIPALGIVGGAISYMLNRRDKNSDTRQSNSDKRDALLAGENAAIIANLRLENDRCNARLDEAERERHEANQNARFWEAMAWSVAGQARRDRQLVESFLRGLDPPLPPPVWTGSLDLPAFTPDLRRNPAAPILPGE